MPRTYSTGSAPERSIASRMRKTASFAPPCSGPLSVPMADVTAECMSEKRRSGNAGRKRRSVQLVVRMQNQSHIKCPGGCPGRTFAGQHVQEVSGVVQKAVRFDQRLVPCESDRSKPRSSKSAPSAGSLCDICLVVIRLFFRIKEGKRGDDRSAAHPWAARAWRLPEQTDDASVEFALSPQGNR